MKAMYVNLCFASIKNKPIITVGYEKHDCNLVIISNLKNKINA